MKLFRALVVAMVVCIVANIAAVLLEPGPPDEITDWFVQNGGGVLTPIFQSEAMLPLLAFIAVCVAFLIVWVAAVYGLMAFKPWARKLFIGCTIFGYLWLPLMGHTWTTPVDGLFNALTFSCEGAVLVLLFVSPIRERFESGPRSGD